MPTPISERRNEVFDPALFRRKRPGQVALKVALPARHIVEEVYYYLEAASA